MREKIKVLILEFCGYGGMLHYAEGLNKGLENIANTIVFSTQSEGSGFYIFDKIKDKLQKKYNPIYYIQMAKALVINYSPQIVHITSQSVGLLFLIIALNRFRTKVVYTVHDPIPHDERRTLWGAILGRINRIWLQPLTLSRLDAIHVHSEIHKRQLLRRFPTVDESKVYVVTHGGGATPRIKSGTKTPQELVKGSDKIVFLFFGRIEKYKGLEVLLDAFAKLKQENANAVLLIAGSGSFLSYDALDPKLDGIILINRFIDDDEISALFKFCNVVVLPYSNATQSGVIHLAYEFEKAIIVTNVGALPELVKHQETGLVIEPGNHFELYVAMKTLLEDTEKRTKYGLRGREFMKEAFSWEKVAELHFQRYEKLISFL